jgi:hypothetical protein
VLHLSLFHRRTIIIKRHFDEDSHFKELFHLDDIFNKDFLDELHEACVDPKSILVGEEVYQEFLKKGMDHLMEQEYEEALAVYEWGLQQPSMGENIAY